MEKTEREAHWVNWEDLPGIDYKEVLYTSSSLMEPLVTKPNFHPPPPPTPLSLKALQSVVSSEHIHMLDGHFTTINVTLASIHFLISWQFNGNYMIWFQSDFPQLTHRCLTPPLSSLKAFFSSLFPPPRPSPGLSLCSFIEDDDHCVELASFTSDGSPLSSHLFK